MGLTVVGHLLFELFAEGFWSALDSRALTDAGWAGTYMTSLKLLADQVDAKMMSSATAGHAASIGLSGAASFATRDLLARHQFETDVRRERQGARPELVVFRDNLRTDSRKTPASNIVGIRADGTSG